MWELDPATDLTKFREIRMPQHKPTSEPAKRVVVWVDIYGYGIQTHIYLFDAQYPFLMSLQDFWEKTYVQGAIMDMKWYDPGDAELKIIR